MNKVINILVGPPGSGKSTFAKNCMETGFVRISQDDQGRDGHRKAFESAIQEGRDIVVDRMNFDKNQRAPYINAAKNADYSVAITVFHEPREVCYKRIIAREGHPTINGNKGKWEINESDTDLVAVILNQKAKEANSALDTFFTRYQKPTKDESELIVNIGWEQSKGSALIVDIDGTIADIEHRRHHLDRSLGKPNWRKFFDEMYNDKPNTWCVELINAFMMAGQRELIFASGRPDSYREITEEWLSSVMDGPNWKALLMRHRNDSRQDNIVKEIILEFELKTRYKNLLFVDDRQQVVDMYRSHGYTVLQCDRGDF